MCRALRGALVTILAVCIGCGAPATPRSAGALPEPAWVRTSPLATAAGAGGLSEDWASNPTASGSDPFDSATRRIERELPEVRALLVVHRGRLVLERYFRGAGPTTAFNTKSVTKSVVSALVGIAIRDGHIQSLDQPISTWLAGEMTGRTAPGVAEMKLRHLLAMTTGWEWRENGPETSAWLASPNRVRFMLEQPMNAPAGTRFNYSTGAAHLVSAILTRATGVDTRAYAVERLFKPLGINAGDWGRDPQGFYEGGSELELTARDMARFGVLYLHAGRWNGAEIVPRSWVLESTTPHGRVDYGYLWSYLPREWGGPAVNALGYGGQIISIVPAADAVVVIASTTADPQNPAMQLLREDLLPALLTSR